jgi:uncharacterized protein (UPF0297 family)
MTKEKSRVLGLIVQVMERYPELRFVQIIGNVYSGDPYYISDKMLGDLLMSAYEFLEEPV